MSETRHLNRENILKALLRKINNEGRCKFYGFDDIDTDNDIINIPMNIVLENDDKILYTYIYLYMNTNKLNESIFSLEDLIVSYGLKINSGKGKSNELFKNTLNTMCINEYIHCNTNISDLKLNKLYRCRLIKDSSTIIKVHYKNIEKILNLKLKESNVTILRTYIYLLYQLNSIYNISTGISNIANIINIAENTMTRYLNILRENNLIYFYDAEYINTSFGTIRGGTYYATNENNLNTIKENIEYIKL
jgi:hypothetical protein